MLVACPHPACTHASIMHACSATRFAQLTLPSWYTYTRSTHMYIWHTSSPQHVAQWSTSFPSQQWNVHLSRMTGEAEHDTHTRRTSNEHTQRQHTESKHTQQHKSTTHTHTAHCSARRAMFSVLLLLQSIYVQWSPLVPSASPSWAM